MNENALRWKTRIGSLKGVAGFVLLFAVVILIVAVGDLSMATSNPREPQSVGIGQLVRGDVGTNRYVSVAGMAFYPSAYQKTEDNRVVDEYFFLVDAASGDAILIKAEGAVPIVETTEPATVAGLTHPTESKLKTLVESDLPDIHEAGFEINTGLYVGQGEKPPDPAQQTMLITVLGLVSLACITTFFFPRTLFGPRPIDASAAHAQGDPGMQATGRFQKLNSVTPAIQIGKGTRQFNGAVANVVTLDNRRLMIYIHHILTTKTYGITVRKQETDWGAFIDSTNVLDIEPGKLYGWRERWAVRLRYNDEKGKPQTLIVTFHHAGAQSDLVNLLRQRGFAVGSGEMPLM